MTHTSELRDLIFRRVAPLGNSQYATGWLGCSGRKRTINAVF